MSSTDMILSQNSFLQQVERGITKKKKRKKIFKSYGCLSYDAYGNTCMKFYEHILNSFEVVERT